MATGQPLQHTALRADGRPLRVALGTWQFPVISETFVSTLAADLLAAGAEVRVLTFDPGHEVAPAGPVQEEVERAGLLQRTGRAGSAVFVGGGGVGRMIGRLLSPRALGRIRLSLREGRFDVVHCQFASLGLAAVNLRRLGLLRTNALVLHVRGHDVTTFVAERGPDVYRRVFERVDGVIANSRHFRDRAVALGCPPERIEVIGSPIDFARFRPPARREPFRDRPLRLVAVGRLVEKKGFADAVEAVRRLRAGGREVSLTILGEGPLRDDLQRRIDDAGLAGHVTLAGAATQGQVIAALHHADLALAPSVRAASGDEDAPVNTLKEAMGTGLPVVATWHGGIPELVVPGENGLLVAERDPGALAEAIARLADRPESWSALGAAGRARAMAEYDRASVCRRTLDAYARALRSRGAGASASEA